jgi:hypothetical protein
MTIDPVEQRIKRITDRMDEITVHLAGLDDQADTVDPAEQAELLTNVTELREEHRVLQERLAELVQDAQHQGA